jgi:murein DD-endopeptidase MepM/ murein hydrolase activator NlpD
MTATSVTDPYLVKSGDTLGAIAKQSGRSVQDLMRWNGIKNANRISVGQTLYLSEKSAFGVSVMFLDALRSPVENLPYKIRFDGKTTTGKTATNGRVDAVVTKDAKSSVEVLVQDLRGEWISVCKTASEYGHKLLTLVSGAIVIKGRTETHPPTAPTKPKDAPPQPEKDAKQAPLPAKASGAPSKNNPAVKTKKTKAKQGQDVIQIGIDIPQGLLSLFANYKGGEITAAEWQGAADLIGCEPEVLKAIAEVESGGRYAFWRLNKADGKNIPAILYERHCFSTETKRMFDKDHPDISWPTPYVSKKALGEKNFKMSDGKVDADDVYSSYASSYLRLINAYRLDATAALKSCSWGKFQILGTNYNLCGTATPAAFVKQMCTSDAAQIGLLAEFIRKKPQSWISLSNKKLGKEISLHEAVKTKNWAAIAFNYNGSDYKKHDYDTKLKGAYERLKKST